MSAADGIITQADEQLLHAYFDGELSRVARWRFDRRLARSASLREQLGELGELSARVREFGRAGPEIDLWDRIEMRLPAIDAERAEARSGVGGWGMGGSVWLRHRPLIAAAATAALALALVLGTIEDGAVASPGVVSWLDTGGRSVIVLEDDSDATIVWLLESPSEGAVRQRIPRGGLSGAV